MDVTAALDTPHPADAVWAVIADLSTYPRWLEIVPRADPDDDGGWTVDLRGRLGLGALHPQPLRPGERTEAGTGSRLTMHLHYGGSLWGPVLERLLGDTIERSRSRLLEELARR